MSYFTSGRVAPSRQGLDTSLLPELSCQETVDGLAKAELLSPGSLSSEVVRTCVLGASHQGLHRHLSFHHGDVRAQLGLCPVRNP